MTSERAGTLMRPGQAIERAMTALVAGKVHPAGEAEFLKSKGDDGLTGLVLRAATGAASLGNNEWAGGLAQQAVVDFLISLAPASAGAELLRRALSLDFVPAGSVSAPSIVTHAVTGGFVGEGEPGNMVNFTVGGPTLEPRKLMIIAAISRTLSKSSNAEKIVSDALRQAAALTFDQTLLSADAGSADSAAGLLWGLTSLTPSSLGGDAAMRADLTAVAEVVAPIASGEIVLVANPKLAVRIALQSGGAIPYPVLPSVGLAEGTIVAIAPKALAFSVDPDPEMSVSPYATLHAEDASPAHIGTAGSPNSAAAPVLSMFQIACLALRIQLWASWGKRHPDAVAFIEGADWAAQ